MDLSVDEATAELHRCAGSQFDPDVVKALTKVLSTGTESAQERARTSPTSALRAVCS